MSITVEIEPEIEAELAASAARRGMDVAEYAAKVLKESVRLPLPEPKNRLTPEEFEAGLDRLAQFSDETPVLPDEATTREGIYQDHD